jgi:hypothetical protein
MMSIFNMTKLLMIIINLYWCLKVKSVTDFHSSSISKIFYSFVPRISLKFFNVFTFLV